MPYTDVLCLSAATGTAPNGLFDGDAIKRTFASPTARTTYVASDLDGEDLRFRFERAVTITTSSSALTYNTTEAFEIHGFDVDGHHISEVIRLTAVGGNETVETRRGFYHVNKIISPSHLLNTGAISIGVGAVVLKHAAVAIEAGTAGVVKLSTANGAMDVTMPANLVRDIAVTRIDRTNATFPVILYR